MEDRTAQRFDRQLLRIYKRQTSEAIEMRLNGSEFKMPLSRLESNQLEAGTSPIKESFFAPSINLNYRVPQGTIAKPDELGSIEIASIGQKMAIRPLNHVPP